MELSLNHPKYDYFLLKPMVCGIPHFRSHFWTQLIHVDPTSAIFCILCPTSSPPKSPFLAPKGPSQPHLHQFPVDPKGHQGPGQR